MNLKKKWMSASGMGTLLMLLTSGIAHAGTTMQQTNCQVNWFNFIKALVSVVAGALGLGYGAQAALLAALAGTATFWGAIAVLIVVVSVGLWLAVKFVNDARKISSC